MDGNSSSAPTLGLAGRYVVRRELGRGMMGVVYEAEDTLLGRTVALKTIDLAFEVAEETYRHFEERFFTEARVAAKLSHPGIVVCHDVGKDPASGKLFIVFEYLNGLTLAERIVADTIPWEDALTIVIKVARAIHHAHVNGVIHRDLKPANVMLLDSGRAGLEASDATAIKIMDFGVARLESLPGRLTGTGQSFGSPLYMSPEQVLGHPATARSDIFSLGSVLCTLLLGRGWFEARNIPEVLARVVHDEAPAVSKLRPQLPGTLDDVVARALAKRPEDRYASAAEMADDLEDVLAGLAPRHVNAQAPVPQSTTAADALLGDLAKDIGRPGAIVDPAEALASLVADAPPADSTVLSPLSSAKADRTLPVQAMPPLRLGQRRPGTEAIPPQAAAELTLPSWDTPANAPASPSPSAPAQGAANQGLPQRSGPASRPRLHLPLKVAAVLGSGVLVASGAFLLWGRSPTDSRSSAVPAPPSESPAACESHAAAGWDADSLLPPVEESQASPSPAIPATSAPLETSAGAPRPPTAVRSRAVPPSSTTLPESLPATTPAGEAPLARMRLTVEHPFESGRLVLWIDGALVYETKLRASASKTIVAIKVREGHLEKLLDIAPGRHEVRVEVSWEDQHRVGSQVIDVAAGATGLLELRVARLTKDLSLEWSRLAD